MEGGPDLGASGLSLPETGPRVWVLLPDQQELQGMLLGQVQGSGGEWMCLVGLSVWEHVQDGEGRDLAVPTSVVSPVPASHVTAIEGEDYRDVLTWRHPRPRPARSQEYFYLQPMRAVRELRYLHHAGCWSPGDRGQPLDAGQARTALATPGTVGCDACCPEKLLCAASGQRDASAGFSR